MRNIRLVAIGALSILLFIVCAVMFGGGEALAQATKEISVDFHRRNLTPSEIASLQDAANKINVVAGGSDAFFTGSGERYINQTYHFPTEAYRARSVVYAAIARPAIPACASDIEVRLGGNFEIRYMGNDDKGTWGQAYIPSTEWGRDYPEVIWDLQHSGEFIYDTTHRLEVYPVTDLMDETWDIQLMPQPAGGLPQLPVLNVYSNNWHGVSAGQASEVSLYIAAELMDAISNRSAATGLGRQWSYKVTGNPSLKVRWNNIGCLSNKPYMHVNGADVISGASFAANGLTDDCEPTVFATNAPIETNGYPNTNSSDWLAAIAGLVGGTSRSQYAVLASGSIGDSISDNSGNTFLGNYGYVRETGEKDALFAFKTAEYGNYYGSAPSSLPCIDISEHQETASEDVALDTPQNVVDFLRGSSSGTREYNNNLDIGSLTIPANGAKKTLVVNGNVHINDNINIQTSYSGPDAIPSVRIIAKNIYIENDVTKIDASLIAAPFNDSEIDSGGVIDTCKNTGGGTGSWPAAPSTGLTINSCATQLRFGGSVIARRILWKRTFGTIGTQASVANTTCYFGNTSDNTDVPRLSTADTYAERSEKCAAEVVDFSPGDYISRFNQKSSEDTITSAIELPPIY